MRIIFRRTSSASPRLVSLLSPALDNLPDSEFSVDCGLLAAETAAADKLRRVAAETLRNGAATADLPSFFLGLRRRAAAEVVVLPSLFRGLRSLVAAAGPVLSFSF